MVKVAIAGTGALAQHLAQASLSLGHEVLLLSRHEQPSLSPLTVITVDYSLPSSLSPALAGVHTLISTIPHYAPQLALINACLEARVVRFAPAEFERAPNLRPFVGGGDDRLNVLEKLRTERHRLDSAVFVCGLFMERFGPGGDGEVLLDFTAGRAWIPVGEGGEVKACFIAIADVGMFVAKALELDEWPEQFKCCGERLGIAEVVTIAERVRGKRFKIRESKWDELQDLLLDAEVSKDEKEVARIDMLLAIQRGEFDFHETESNGIFPDVKTVGFEEWLQMAWRGVRLEERGF